MAGHTSAGCEQTLCGAHTLDILGVGLIAYQNGLLLVLGHCNGLLAGEDDLADSTAGACGQTLCDYSGLLLGCGVKHGVQELVKLCGAHAHNCGLLIDEALLQHIHSHIEGRDAGALAHAALEHPELAVLNGELDVLHIVVVLLEVLADGVQLFVNLGHSLLQ